MYRLSTLLISQNSDREQVVKDEKTRAPCVDSGHSVGRDPLWFVDVLSILAENGLIDNHKSSLLRSETRPDGTVVNECIFKDQELSKIPRHRTWEQVGLAITLLLSKACERLG